jgi:hypothetical protein
MAGATSGKGVVWGGAGGGGAAGGGLTAALGRRAVLTGTGFALGMISISTPG